MGIHAAAHLNIQYTYPQWRYISLSKKTEIYMGVHAAAHLNVDICIHKKGDLMPARFCACEKRTHPSGVQCSPFLQ
jgi:hypothetical protein